MPEILSHLPIFDDEYSEAFQDSQPSDDAAVAALLGAIAGISRKTDALKATRNDVDAWYVRKIEQHQSAIAFLQGKVQGYLEFHRRKSAVTHNGTAFLVSRTETKWPEDQILLKWVAEKGISNCIKVREVPDKSALKRAFETMVERPPGYEEYGTTSLSIRSAST